MADSSRYTERGTVHWWSTPERVQLPDFEHDTQSSATTNLMARHHSTRDRHGDGTEPSTDVSGTDKVRSPSTDHSKKVLPLPLALQTDDLSSLMILGAAPHDGGGRDACHSASTADAVDGGTGDTSTRLIGTVDIGISHDATDTIDDRVFGSRNRLKRRPRLRSIMGHEPFPKPHPMIIPLTTWRQEHQCPLQRCTS